MWIETRKELAWLTAFNQIWKRHLYRLFTLIRSTQRSIFATFDYARSIVSTIRLQKDWKKRYWENGDQSRRGYRVVSTFNNLHILTTLTILVRNQQRRPAPAWNTAAKTRGTAHAVSTTIANTRRTARRFHLVRTSRTRRRCTR